VRSEPVATAAYGAPAPFPSGEEYDAFVHDVGEAAARIQSGLEAERLVYLRAMGAWLAGLSAASLTFLLASSSGLGPIFFPGLTLFWIVLLALGLAEFAFPRPVIAGFERLVPTRYRWRLRAPDTQARQPTLAEATRIFGQLQTVWDRLVTLGNSATFFYAAALAEVAFFVANLWLALLRPTGELALLSFPISFVAVMVPGAVGLLVWSRTHRSRRKALEPAVREVEARFGRLEAAFWLRY
jgi:hypothetical protein